MTSHVSKTTGGILPIAPFYIEGALMSSFTFTPATFLSIVLFSIVSHSKSFWGADGQLY